MSGIDGNEVWLLTGDRPGEIAQQRAIAAALGLPVREIRVARLPASGPPIWNEPDYLRPPWPALVITFGKSLQAALPILEASGGRTRIVHLGRPRGVSPEMLDLIVPMPSDYIDDAPNVLRIRMPLNSPGKGPAQPDFGGSAPPWPHPVTALILGGPTAQHRFGITALKNLVRVIDRQVRDCSGSLLVSTSPRTPPEAIGAIGRIIAAPGELYAFSGNDPRNPLARYFRSADDVIVTGDSASLVAEAWRSGKPLSVATVPYMWLYRLRLALRRILPKAFTRLGIFVAKGDIDRWLRNLAADGHIGTFGESKPWRPYRSIEDNDLAKVVGRIRRLLDTRRPPTSCQPATRLASRRSRISRPAASKRALL